MGGCGLLRAMRVTLLYFAHLRERTGTREESREVPDSCTAGQLRAAVESAHPALKGMLATCRIAVDEEFAADTQPIREGQTIAFIPPVSGG
jgi:molybdopterin converting factor subunit 1